MFRVLRGVSGSLVRLAVVTAQSSLPRFVRFQGFKVPTRVQSALYAQLAERPLRMVNRKPQIQVPIELARDVLVIDVHEA